MRSNLTPKDIERFWSYVDVTGGPDSCWEWQGTRDKDGYGNLTISRDGKWWPERAHRIAWFLANGPIPPDRKIIMHSCDNPPCCNPAHLSNGTNTDNVRDCVRKGRHKGTGPIGENAGRAKLTDDKVRDIRQRYARGGISMQQLGEMYGVTNQSIFAIIHRRTWRHVK